MNRIVFALPIGLALALVACGGSIQTVSAGSDGTTLRHAAGYEGSANQQAQANCNIYAKKARLRSSHDDGGQRFSIYDCVPM